MDLRLVRQTDPIHDLPPLLEWQEVMKVRNLAMGHELCCTWCPGPTCVHVNDRGSVIQILDHHGRENRWDWTNFRWDPAPTDTSNATNAAGRPVE